MLLRVRSAVAVALFAAYALAITAPGPAPAQDKELVAKAKTTAAANLKKANIDKPTVVETTNYLVVGSMPEEKAKALGEMLEKTTTLTRKTLKFDEKESPWKGKLIVYFMHDNAEFKALMRRAFQIPPEGVHADLRAEPAFIVDPAEVSGKQTDADLYANTAARLAGEHLKAKGTGTQKIPDWLRDGFGYATVARAEGTASKRYAAYRAQARTAILGPKGGKSPALADVWGDAKIANGDILAASFADYLAYSTAAAPKFPMLIDGLKPNENNAAPTIPQGLDAAGWKAADLPMLEAAWKRWAAGK